MAFGGSAAAETSQPSREEQLPSVETAAVAVAAADDDAAAKDRSNQSDLITAFENKVNRKRKEHLRKYEEKVEKEISLRLKKATFFPAAKQTLDANQEKAVDKLWEEASHELCRMKSEFKGQFLAANDKRSKSEKLSEHFKALEKIQEVFVRKSEQRRRKFADKRRVLCYKEWQIVAASERLEEDGRERDAKLAIEKRADGIGMMIEQWKRKLDKSI